MKTFFRFLGGLGSFTLSVSAVRLLAAAPLPAFDFAEPKIAAQWHAQHDIASLRSGSDGLVITINGSDPYFAGPARDYPTNTPLWLVLRLKADQAGGGQVFYFRPPTVPTEEQSVRFTARGGDWEEIRVATPSLEPATHLRIDPPGDRGQVVISSLHFERRVTLPAPRWPAWVAPRTGGEARVSSGGVEIRDSPGYPNSFEVRVPGGPSMALGHAGPRLAYVRDERVRWVEIPSAATESSRDGDVWILRSEFSDPDGASWQYERQFSPDSPGVVRVETTVRVNRDREIAFLPLHLLFAGEPSFGRGKHQGLFAGLEYLEDEPSSSEADIEGPESRRQVPFSHKITFPLMAIQAERHYVGLIWEPGPNFSVVFDSPDRLFGSGGHVMGVLFPGSNPRIRAEGSLMPYRGEVLKAGAAVTSRAWMIAGSGETVIPAVQQYIRLRGLPRIPDPGLSFEEYVRLAAYGWLDSKCREGNRYRHAYWPGFPPAPAADAAMFELWLAGWTTDEALASRLRDAARDAIAAVPPSSYLNAGVGHVRTPAPVLVFGSVNENMQTARRAARQLLERFDPDGRIPYRPSPGQPDYGRTHRAPDADGLTAQVVASLLEAAVFSGDRSLMEAALARLRGLNRFRGTVPRGAQTWEVPLHTPDILASAHLVRAYTTGYELTGEREFLDEAIYWAWTGVPFVYLVHPTGQPVGPYSTIAVLGATNWRAPAWFGRPVQWCGMVYADALYRLAKWDPSFDWRHLADGITGAGLLHTWRQDDRERGGLLPDYYELIPQRRDGPAINPATVGINAARFFGRGPVYDLEVFREANLLAQAPCEVRRITSGAASVEFTVAGRRDSAFLVLVSGFRNRPKVRIDDRPISLSAPHAFTEPRGPLVLQFAPSSARVKIQIEL